MDDYRYGKRHSVLRTIGNAREIPRITTKLKLVTGTYTLQCNRAAINQNQIDNNEEFRSFKQRAKKNIHKKEEPTCLLCKTEEETVEHSLLNCTALHSARQPMILDIIKGLYTSLHEPQLTNIRSHLLQIVLDCSALYQTVPKRNHHLLESIEFHSRRLSYMLHCERNKRLAVVPQSVRKKKTSA